jgi:hypothetical protein
MDETTALVYISFMAGLLFQMSGIPAWGARQVERGSYAFARWIVGVAFAWRERREARHLGYYALRDKTRN